MSRQPDVERAACSFNDPFECQFRMSFDATAQEKTNYAINWLREREGLSASKAREQAAVRLGLCRWAVVGFRNGGFAGFLDPDDDGLESVVALKVQIGRAGDAHVERQWCCGVHR